MDVAQEGYGAISLETDVENNTYLKNKIDATPLQKKLAVALLSIIGITALGFVSVKMSGGWTNSGATLAVMVSDDETNDLCMSSSEYTVVEGDLEFGKSFEGESCAVRATPHSTSAYAFRDAEKYAQTEYSIKVTATSLVHHPYAMFRAGSLVSQCTNKNIYACMNGYYAKIETDTTDADATETSATLQLCTASLLAKNTTYVDNSDSDSDASDYCWVISDKFVLETHTWYEIRVKADDSTLSVSVSQPDLVLTLASISGTDSTYGRGFMGFGCFGCSDEWVYADVKIA